MIPTCSLAEALAWLAQLDTQIHTYHPPTDVHEVGYNEILRPITAEEWKMVTELVAGHDLPCRHFGGAYGFSLTVYKPGVVEGILPDEVLWIEHNQFPFPSVSKGFGGQEETLRILAPLTHNPRNQQLLAWSGFELQHPAEQYAY